MIRIKRVREPSRKTDGKRFLVERLWPRGIKKKDLKLDGWLKDAGPSTDLRKWFNHDPAKWEEFQRRYKAELDAHPQTWEPIMTALGEGEVTLLFSSHDSTHNNVVALKDYLESKRR